MTSLETSVLSLILGGGQGARLFPLTQLRAKPAVPVAGKYRLIDIPISNCINSGLNRIYVLTQFLSVSLHRHIANTYKFDMFSKGFVEILAAQQTIDGSGWYEGTADAVRRQILEVQQDHCEHVLILSGDQLYRMDYRELIKTHTESKADITIAALPVHESQVHAFGVLRCNDAGRVIQFLEKPQTPEAYKPFYTPAEWIEARGIKCAGRHYLASMGIYLFRKEVLLDLLLNVHPIDKDFGKDIFPKSIGPRKVQTHLFDGFWEDLGTIKSYHQVSIELALENPPFEFYTAHGAIYTRRRLLPASRVIEARLKDVLLSDGCVVLKGADIERSLLGVRSRIGKRSRIFETVIIGADHFETDEDRARNALKKIPNLNVGDDCHIERAILDKDCRVGNGVTINYKGKELRKDGDCYYIRDGIVVIPKGVIVPDGTKIE
ncbi:MAG: glucose-1-phosphate adenylyltransferase [Gemmataceae bacterium]|jgi:glucose-1-phosphate adenylyltransferase|nr:glucose-1-phosphate adenylyltransferase [Gemmataceae bacterium]